MVSNWGYSCLAMLVSLFGFPWWYSESVARSAVMVSSWQMLCGGRSPTVVVELISCRWLKYIYFIVQCCV
jgi:hypothetical protein